MKWSLTDTMVLIKNDFYVYYSYNICIIDEEEAEAEDAESQQTQISMMPPGTNSKQNGMGPRINVEFIPGSSG